MIRIEPAGAEALLLVLAEEPGADLPLRLVELARRLREEFGAGVRDLVPGWTGLLLHYDAYRVDPQVLEARLRPLLAEWRGGGPPPGRGGGGPGGGG
ncbi:carboxyltransferase domain-containing protein [Pseudomonas aeruginosa]|nr:carboxyltransferase domain-containing protein [Pseudomonas aeruginosa]